MSNSPRLRSVRWLLAISGGLLLATGCSTLRVETDYDSELDFSSFREFAWLEPPVRSDPVESPAEEMIDPFARNSLLDKRIRHAVERELGARGYRLGGDGRADFYLRYYVILKDRTRIQGYGHGPYGFYGHPYRWGGHTSNISTYNYQEGTLIVDMIDASTHELAWRGWAVGINREGYYTDKKVGEAVKQVIARFPPDTAGNPGTSDREGR